MFSVPSSPAVPGAHPPSEILPPPVRLATLLQQSAVTNDALLQAAMGEVDYEYALELLNAQEQRRAANFAALRAEGWFDPPEKRQKRDNLQFGAVLGQHNSQGGDSQASDQPADASTTATSPYITTAPDFEKIQELTGRKFTLNSTSFPEGRSPYCEPACTPSSPFSIKDVKGQHTCVCAPVLEVQDYIKNYITHEQDSPYDTSACFVVPKCGELPHPALSGVKVFIEYRKGYQLYTKCGDDTRGGRLNKLP